ncbi:H-NS histone family protein [Burkholderia pyrrocinia]
MTDEDREVKNYASLRAQFDELQRELEVLREREINIVIERVLGVLADSGIRYQDLVRYGQPAAREPRRVAPKYWNRETGETWTGRGREPRWIAGQDRESFRLPANQSDPENREDPARADGENSPEA